MIPVGIHEDVIDLILHRDTLKDGRGLGWAQAVLRELLRALAVLLAIGLHDVIQPQLLLILAVHVVERVTREQDEVSLGRPRARVVARHPKLQSSYQ